MIDPMHHGDIRIDHVHSAALCTEIGERLAIGLREPPIVMSPRLMMLVSRLRGQPLMLVNSIG